MRPTRNRGGGAAPPARLLDDDPVAVLRAASGVDCPVLQTVLERARTGSRPGARSDEHTVCLAVEGGGLRGAVSAGMCVVLEATGLVDAFDRIYGVSAGALNGCATATRQAALSATHYEDAVRRRVINPVRSVRGQPVIDYDLLFDDVIAARKPLAFERLAAGPDFRSLATSLDTLTLRVLTGFTDSREMLQAIRVSAALPRLAGKAPAFRGERMIDGGLLEPIPFETPVSEGASHVLVLRSRPATYRKPRCGGLGDALGLHGNRQLATLIRAGNRIYNRQAARLEHGPPDVGGGVHVCQIAVPEQPRGVTRLRADVGGIAQALRAGAKAMASAVLAEPIDLCWEPVVRRAIPGVVPVAWGGPGQVGEWQFGLPMRAAS